MEQNERKIEDLKKHDLVEPYEEPLIAPANLVPAKRKGSDQIRLCVDYKRLNKTLSHNFFPLPVREKLMEDLGKLGKKAVISQFDLNMCFHQFVLDEDDRYLTAFYAQHEILQWKRLPFGLKSAPGIVQMAIQREVLDRGPEK